MPTIHRGINHDIFTDESPYRIKSRLASAVREVGGSDNHGWLFFTRKQADQIADLINKEIFPGGRVFLTGAALWDLASLEEPGKVIRTPPRWIE